MSMGVCVWGYGCGENTYAISVAVFPGLSSILDKVAEVQTL